MADRSESPIDNPGSNHDADIRRTGGSSNDPHGGHQHPDSEWHGPEPDPVEELVPAGTGELPATRRSISETTDDLAYTGSQVPNLTDELAGPDGMGTLDAQLAPGFGPGELDKPQLEGNPELGIDPNDVAPTEPTGPGAVKREGMYETGKRG
jgi:hypothetical protein